MKTFGSTLVVIILVSAANALEIPLTVKEPVGVARRNAPVSSGVPLPRGQFKADQQFALFDGDREIPLQAAPLVVDRDGSLRWVLLDFQIDVNANETRRLTLRTQSAKTKHANPIQIIENDNTINVNTGPLAVRVKKNARMTRFQDGLEVSVRGKRVVNEMSPVFQQAGTIGMYAAGKPEKIDIEYEGPLRATLRIEGLYERESPVQMRGGTTRCPLKYITRITVWAGRTDMRVQHILANSNPTQVFHANVKTASILVGHAMPDSEVWLGAGDISFDLNKGEAVWLHQGKINRYYGAPIADAVKTGASLSKEGDASRKAEWSGTDCTGWLALRGNDSAMLVVDRDFSGDPPRRLYASDRSLMLEFISSKFTGGRGEPFASDHYWLYDCSHKTAEYWIDFDAKGEREDFDKYALAARERLMAFAPAEWYSECDVFGVGHFGSLEDEKNVYEKWGWKFDEMQLPRSKPDPNAFVQWEDNHYESEADSVEALVLMAIRTGQRGYFDQAEAWARYHANLHAWRTDGWVYDDGAIWFPQGGPLGTRRARKPDNVKYQHWGKGTGDDKELWHQVQAKACYCHFYGAGLVDFFLLTGERDFLEAAIDLAEQKNSEYHKHREFTPGKTTISDTRGFGRGFYVITHLLEAAPDNEFVGDLARLCRDVLWECPNLDERGFAPCHIGTGFGGFDLKKNLTPNMKKYMDEHGITIDEKGWMTDREGNRWPVVCLGGTWQHAYVHDAADRYAQVFGDEDMADFSVAFGRFTSKYMLSEPCKQTQYYTYMDVPEKGRAWDPWQFEPPHTENKKGEGCTHSGWYTRFFPDAMARAYSLTGDRRLLDRAREFWHYGSKRGYQTKGLKCGWDEVGMFANHTPPKDDTVLSTARMFYEWSHLRRDSEPPKPVTDLRAANIGDGKATLQFTAPADAGGGKVVRYQAKCATLPIVSYDDYDFARDDGKKRNFWRATNLTGEPQPAKPGSREAFVVEGVPAADNLYFVIVGYDDSNNRSGLSSVVGAGN